MQDGIAGQDIQPKRDLTRYVKWPLYIQRQRKMAILRKRIKVPPTLNQFTNTLDRQTATQLFRLLDNYRPETRAAEKERLKKRAEEKAKTGEDKPTKRPLVVRHGCNTVSTLIEQKKAQLVVIAHDVDPVELVVHIPAICRKMDIPYCIVKNKSRLGRVVHRKTTTCLALTGVKPVRCIRGQVVQCVMCREDRSALSKLVDAMRTNYNERHDEIRRHWGGGIMGAKSQARKAKLEKIKARELAQRATV
ncbi:RPL7A [Cordylochernes scorpioides]|uniref:60S ribosomal protein L7a n=1 Tax=Cordylochernes scorpioides TaxID=51811 RepID=A0ABY6KUI1_9ARAC|nr:RPL7A [Cordylochernes scorpioides]